MARLADRKRSNSKLCAPWLLAWCLLERQLGIFTDLTGRTFAHVTVTGQSGKNKHGQITWRAVCECGEERFPNTGDLTSGKIKSCGCMKVALCRGDRVVDLVGKRFNRLLVVSLSHIKTRKYYWNCVCDCGNACVIAGGHMKNGATTSCGCVRKETTARTRVVHLTGQRFGMLVVVKPAGIKTGGRLWECLCDCGGRKNILAAKLTTGVGVSCGCAKHRAWPRVALTSIHTRAMASAHGAKRRAQKLDAGGSFTAAQITELYGKQRGRCAGPGCGVKLGDSFHRDHRVALSRGGSNDILNMELLCQPCNARKHAKDPIDWARENGRLI